MQDPAPSAGKKALNEEPEKPWDGLSNDHSLFPQLELTSAQHLYKEQKMQSKPGSNVPKRT